MTLAIKLIKKDETFNHQLSTDSSVNFTLASLSKRQVLRCLKFTNDGEVTLSSDSLYELVGEALIGWSGIQTEDGKDLPFPRNGSGKIKLDVLNDLPIEVVTELANKVLELNSLTDDEKK